MCVESFPGGGWWPIHQQIYSHKSGSPDWFDQIKLMIVVHTFSSRSFSMDQRIHRAHPQAFPLNWSRNDYDEPTIAHSMYHKYIYNEKFHTWAQIKGFDDLDQFLNAHPQIHSVHLYLDEETLELSRRSTFSSGANRTHVSTTLMEIVRSQYTSNDRSRMASDIKYGFYNHLTPYNNIVLADQLYKIINYDQTDLDLTQFKPYD